MSQNNSNEKSAAMAAIEKINEVEGFDPAQFAVEYTDLNTQEKSKRLPVMIQMAWFRLKYPEGKIAIQIKPGSDCFIATARVYPSYKDAADAYLSEATASRGPCKEKPSVSPREWAQTAAVGIALRNAGFGLQFSMAGEDFESIAPDELTSSGSSVNTETAEEPKAQPAASASPVNEQPDEEYEVAAPSEKELTPEERLEKAMNTPCPISKFGGKTLGEVLALDPKAVNWVATKFPGNEEIKEAARTICEYAVSQAE